MTVAQNLANVTNFLVPAGGTTHAVRFVGGFSSVPFLVDWRQFAIDSFPFQPQGVYIDNTAGANPCTVKIFPLGYTVTCAAGASIARHFPAPNGQTTQITGDPGNATCSVIFVDYPVFPQG